MFFQPSSTQLSTYSNFYSIATNHRNEQLAAKEVVLFLRKSGLDNNVLRKVWTITSEPGNMILSRERFYSAIALTALYQQGRLDIQDITTLSKIDASTLPLPIFQGIHSSSSSSSTTPSLVPNNMASSTMNNTTATATTTTTAPSTPIPTSTPNTSFQGIPSPDKMMATESKQVPVTKEPTLV